MITFPIPVSDVAVYCFFPRKLAQLRRDLFEDYMQLTRICRILPLRLISDFTGTRIILPGECSLTPTAAILLNQAAAALRQRASLATRLNSAVSHAASTRVVDSLALALLHTLDETNAVLAHLERLA